MGKKQGQAQRTKGNIQPSNSAKAAELLEQANFSNFGTDLTTNLAGMTFLEDALDINMDSEFRLVFRKISKKDALTKQKGLEELRSLVDSKSIDDCVNIIPYWAKQYTKLSIDYDRKIRELCQQTHEKVCLKVTKNLAPSLKTIMPYWILAQCDPYNSSSTKAQNAFRSVFSDTKQPEVINFAKTEILNVIHDNLVVETVKTLSDLKYTNEDEAIQKYETVVAMSFAGLNFLLSFLTEQSINELNEKLENLFDNPKFWKFSKEKSPKMKSSFYQLLNVLAERLPQALAEKFKIKMIPLVFYACDEEDYNTSAIIWQIILKCVLSYQETWTLVNIKKAFLPKLYSVLRRNANVNREAMYSVLLPFIKNIPDTVIEEKVFYNELLGKINEGIKESTTKLNNPTIAKQLECYFECLKYILTKYAAQDETFCESLIDSFVIPLISDYFESTELLNNYQNAFNIQIEQFIQFLNSYENISGSFWTKIERLVVKDDVYDQQKGDKIITSFISLFKTLDLTKLKHLEGLIGKLLKTLFNKYENNKDISLIKSLSKLSLYFMNENLINSLVESNENSSLELFNGKLQVYIEESLNQSNLDVYFELVNLFLIVNLNLQHKTEIFNENLFKSFIKNESDYYKFLNFIFANQNSILTTSTIASNVIKTKFLHVLFNSDLTQTYIIDDYFRKLNLFHKNLTNKNDIGLELITVNNLIKYLIEFNNVSKTDTSSLLLINLNTEIINNLKTVLQFLLKDNQLEHMKIVKKFLNFSSNFFKQQHQQSDFTNLWSFMFDLINLEFTLTETELKTNIEELNVSCVRLLDTDNLVELVQYVKLGLESGESNLVDVIFKLIDCLAEASEKFKTNLKQFVQDLIDSQVKNLEIYGYLTKQYLNATYLRAYTENDAILLLLNDGDLFESNIYDFDANEATNKENILRKLNFELKLINRYNVQHQIFDLFDSEFYYLITSCLILRYFNFYKVNEVAILNEIENELKSFILNNNIESANIKTTNKKHYELYFLFLSHILSIYKNNSKITLIKFLNDLFNSYFEHQTVDVLFNQHISKYLFYDFNMLTKQDYKFEVEIAYFEELHAKLLSLNDLLKSNANEFLTEFTFNLNLLTKYTKFMLDSSDIPNLKDALVPTLSKVLDLIIDLKLSESLEFQNFFKILLNDKLNKFLKLFFTQTNKLEAQQLSAYLTSKQWDFISIYVAKAAQKHSNSDLSTNQSLQLIFTSFYDLLFHYIKCMQINIEEMNKFYPKNISSEWNGFFSKEIFDPLLVYYVKTSNKLNSSNQPVYLSYLELNALSKLCATVSLIPVVRLTFNELETNLNANDYSVLNNTNKTSTFNLNDKLQTTLNTLYPLLNNPYRQIQLSTYLILDKLMFDLPNYYKVNEKLEADQEETSLTAEDTNIIKLLPYIVQQSLLENMNLVSNIKQEINFEDSLIEDHDLDLSSNNLVSFLFTSKLFLNLLASNLNLELKVKLISDLKNHKFDDYLINCLFRLMPKNPIFNGSINLFDYSNRNPLCNDEWNLLTNADVNFNDFFIQKYSCDLYKHTLKVIPALIRDWWNRQIRRIADYVDKFTSKFVSPVLISNEAKDINSSNTTIGSNNGNDEYESVIKIKGVEKTREIVTIYKVKDLTMELVLCLPHNYPLGVIDVNCVKRLGVSENEWRNWLLQLTTYLTHQNGDILESLKIWKRNVDKKFNGVEECTICYSVIHGTNYQLPKMKCRTCRKKFHSSCLYKWFESSNNSTCPLCRNLF